MQITRPHSFLSVRLILVTVNMEKTSRSKASPDEESSRGSAGRPSDLNIEGKKTGLGNAVHFLWLSVAMFFCALMISTSTYSQYIVAYFVKEVRAEWNVTGSLNASDSSGCQANDSSLGARIMAESQSRSAQLKIYISLSSGIPNLLTVLAVGVYSDRVGRKFLFVLPSVGYMVLVIVYSVVSYWELPINIVLAGHFIEGIMGGFITNLIGAFAYTSDLTEAGNSRSFRIALIESMLAFCLGLMDLVVGYMIHGWGYTIPFIVAFILLAANIGVIVVLLPESRPRQETKPTSVKEYLKSTFYFYFTKQANRKRFLFRISGAVFFLVTVAVLGKPGVDILFMLNSPLCWNSVKIGYYGIAHRASIAIGSILLVGGLQRWLSDSKLGLISAITIAAATAIQGFARNDTMMYIGAMFGGVAFVEAFTSLCSGVTFSAVYRATLSLFHGAVYLIIALLLATAGVLFMFLDFQLRKTSRHHGLDLEPERKAELDILPPVTSDPNTVHQHKFTGKGQP